MYCTYVFMCMENESDTNKTAGIDLCQGIFVGFVPDVYLKCCKKNTNQAASRKKAKKSTGFLDDGYHWLISTRGGGKLHLQGQGDCSLRWIISTGCCEVFHFLVVPLITWGKPISLKGWFKGFVSMASGMHCEFQ